MASPKSAEQLKKPDLINGRNDSSIRQDLFLQLLLGEVRDAYALDFSGLEQIFHLLPSVFEFPIEQDVTAGTIWKGGEIWVVPVWVEGTLGGEHDYAPSVHWLRGWENRVVTYRPMDQVKIDVIETEVLQTGIEAFLNALMKGVRELTRDLPLISNQSETSTRSPIHLRRSRTAAPRTDVYPLQLVPRYDTT